MAQSTRISCRKSVLQVISVLAILLCGACRPGQGQSDVCSNFGATLSDTETVPSGLNGDNGPSGLLLELENPAGCRGNAVAWHYCFHLPEDAIPITYSTVLGVYRRQTVGLFQTLYNRVDGSPVTIQIIPGVVYPPGGYFCGMVLLPDPFTVLEGDIIGACIPNGFALDVGRATENPNKYLYEATGITQFCTDSVLQQTNSANWDRTAMGVELMINLEFAQDMAQDSTQPQPSTPVSVDATTTNTPRQTVLTQPQPSTPVSVDATTTNTNSEDTPQQTVLTQPQPSTPISVDTTTTNTNEDTILQTEGATQPSDSSSTTDVTASRALPNSTLISPSHTHSLQLSPPSTTPTPFPSVFPEQSDSSAGLRIGAIIGILTGLGVVLFIVLLNIAGCCLLYRKGYSRKGGKTPRAHNVQTMVTNELYASEEQVNNEKPYYKPASNEDDLYSQLREQNLGLIPREALDINQPLGKGHFGVVDKGIWHDSTGMIYEVAVKSLSQGSSREERIKFLQEAAIMGQFKHQNVLQLYGVVVENSQVMLVLEIAHCGDLKKYLKTTTIGLGTPSNPAVQKQLLSFSKDIAVGMHYLASKGFVHRDLAARNVLLTTGKTCKICDFGMSRDLEDETYYISRSPLVPLKWTAPEAVRHRKYSTASDVWSYGCVLYEIWSLGQDPYENFSNSEVVEKLESGYRLPPPAGCPPTMHELMIKCWDQDAHLRPTFSSLLVVLLRSWNAVMGYNAVERDDGYISIADVESYNRLTPPQSYFNTDLQSTGSE